MKTTTACALMALVFFVIGAATGQHIGAQKLYYGAAYYPETWPDAEIDKDIAHMKALNMNVMRMAEFSWAKMEPREGEYDFAWLHRVVEKLHANGIDVILGTPTATPPAWMWEKYPEIAAVWEDGRPRQHGARRDCSYTSGTYRAKSVEITERMAQEFGKKPGVIGWQTDNEFNLISDYSPTTRARWTEWLSRRYGSIERLNDLWANDLWSQTYQRFDQIPLPIDKIWHHPSMQFDWTAFCNDMVVEYQDLQIKAIRKHSDLPITHDGMPGQLVDYEKLMRPTDYVSVNNYHSFEAYDRIISNYDRMRGFGKGTYWLFETAPNYSGGGKEGMTWFLHQPEGSMKAALWMNYALGGQGAMFWLWRQHRAGQEMTHGSVLSAWGMPAANYDDLRQLGAELNKASDFLMSHPVAPARAAILYSHLSDAALRIENQANGIRYYTDWTYRFYLPFIDAGLHRDVVYPSAPLEGYDLLFVPLMPVMTPELSARLEQWVKNGGTLVLGPMSGYRTEYFAAHTNHALGPLSEWSGVRVASRIPVGTSINPKEVPLRLQFSDGTSAPAGLWSEALEADAGAAVLATYNSGMHKGKAAIVERPVGKGKVVLLGTDPGRETIGRLLSRFAREKNIVPSAMAPSADVLAVPRRDTNSEGLVLVHLRNAAGSVTLPAGKWTDLLSGRSFSGKVALTPYQVAVLKKD